jgi:glycosyltransferase involved in cell wall biosynthesis
MGRPVRVLWLIDSLTTGGAEALLPALARAVDARELALSVCALRTIGGNPHQGELAAAGVPVANLETRNLRDRRAFRALENLLARQRIDIVHAHLTYASIWGAVATRRAGLPLVATLHTLPCDGPPWSRDRLRERLMCRLLRRPGVQVLAVSQAVREAYAAARLLPAARVDVLHNGIDEATFAAGGDGRATRAELGVPPSAPVVCAVAVLRRGKGIEDLLRALSRLREAHPELHALIAGDGPLRPELEGLAAALGLARRVHWLGFRRDVPRILAASDLFVLPSRFEALPTALLEAMAAGVPAIAAEVGGVPEILGEPPCGLPVPPGDEAALAGAMAELLAAPAGERAALGAQGRARLVREFTTTVWADRLARLYRRRLDAHAPPAVSAAEAA